MSNLDSRRGIWLACFLLVCAAGQIQHQGAEAKNPPIEPAPGFIPPDPGGPDGGGGGGDGGDPDELLVYKAPPQDPHSTGSVSGYGAQAPQSPFHHQQADFVAAASWWMRVLSSR